MVSNNNSKPSEFIYINDDMSPNAHHWAQNIEGTKDIAIKPREAFAWFQDPAFVQTLLKATDDRWENPMHKDLILIESLALNNADVRATIARLQKTTDRNKALAWKTLEDINKRTRMRKFNRVIELRQQVSKQPPVSPATSQPFVSAPSTPPPLTRDASRRSSPPNSAKSTQTRYTPYTDNRRSTPPNTVPLDPKVTDALYQEMQKLITPALAYKLKSADETLTPPRRNTPNNDDLLRSTSPSNKVKRSRSQPPLLRPPFLPLLDVLTLPDPYPLRPRPTNPPIRARTWSENTPTPTTANVITATPTVTSPRIASNKNVAGVTRPGIFPETARNIPES